MTIENTKKIERLKNDLREKAKGTLEEINYKYIDSDKSGGFIDPGEIVEPDYENAKAKNEHIAYFKSLEAEIETFIQKIKGAMEQFKFKSEDNWVEDKLNHAKEFENRLEKLI